RPLDHRHRPSERAAAHLPADAAGGAADQAGTLPRLRLHERRAFVGGQQRLDLVDGRPRAGRGARPVLRATLGFLRVRGHLRLAFARMALSTAVVAAFRMLSGPLWGRAMDRGRARHVLVAGAVGLGLSPFLWIFATEDRLWPLAIDAALSGTATAALSLATF